jgi:anti-sigma factor RsiW
MECSVFREELIETLYGESGPETAARVDEHLAACGACRRELDALRALRRDLQRWEAPRTARTPLPRRRRLVPALAAAAAVVLAVGGGLALAGSELRFEDGRIAFRLGRGAIEVERLLAEQEQRHRREIEALRASLAPVANDDAALLRQVDQMLRQSEARQAVLLNASLAGLEARAEAQRRYDLARVSAGLSYLDGKTGEQVARTTELVGYALQASQKR